MRSSRAILLILGVVLAGLMITGVALVKGLSGSSRMAYLGNWTGGLQVTGGDPKALNAGAMSGFLQLYRTRDTFWLKLNNRFQVVEVRGYWTLTENSVTLRPEKIDVTVPTESAEPGKSVRLIDGVALRREFPHELLLKIEPNKTTLTSPIISLDALQGKLSFERSNRASYIK